MPLNDAQTGRSLYGRMVKWISHGSSKALFQVRALVRLLTIWVLCLMIVLCAGLAHLGRAEVFQTSGEGIVAPIPL